MNNEEKILAMLEKLNNTVEKQGEILAQHSELLNQVNNRVDQVQDNITGIKLRLELDVEKRFDAVDEGIDAVLETLTPKSRVDELEADVVVLKSAIKMLSQEIAELKKAQ